MKHCLPLGLCLPLVLSACVTPVPVQPVDPADQCGAGPLQYLVGQDKSVFAAMSFVSGTRIIEPGTAITMDYNPARLNFDLDTRGRISRVWCG